MQARLSEKTQPLISPYLDIVRAVNPQAALAAYPGSPLIARAMLLRTQDRLTACEIELSARKRLIDALRRDTQGPRLSISTAGPRLPAFVPPNERRGLVLIDPPFRSQGRVPGAWPTVLPGLREMADRQLSALVSGEEPPRHRHPRPPCRPNRGGQQARRQMPAA